MHGRWARVRSYDSQGWGQPYLLDRKWSLLKPLVKDKAPDGEYWQTQDGQHIWCPQGVLPVIRGGAAGWKATLQTPFVRMGQHHSNATQNPITLSNNYTYNSAGNAIGSQFIYPTALTLSKAYFYIVSFGGTAANVNDINFEFRNHSTNKPGSTLHDSATLDPAATVGWNAFTGLTFDLTANTLYWAVVGDADGDGTDNAVLLRNLNSSGSVEDRQRINAYSTTDGWATVVTSASAIASMVLLFTNGLAIGNPITTSTNPASSTNRRGWNFSAGFKGMFDVWGMTHSGGNSLASSSGMEVFVNDALPSATPDGTTTNITVTGTGGSAPTSGYVFATPYRIRPGLPYRFVYTFSGASTSVPQLSIGAGVNADLLAAWIGGGSAYYTLANGTTDWSNDVTDAQPGLNLIIDDLVSMGAPSLTLGL